MSNLFIAQPPAELAAHVDALFVVAGISDNSIGLRLPKHAPELVVALEGRYTVLEGRHDEGTVFEDAWLTGMCTTPVMLLTEGRSRMVGARFTPWGARAFANLPQVDLRDRSVQLHRLWGAGAAGALRLALAGADDDEAAVSALTAALCHRLDPTFRTPAPVVHACTLLAAARGKLTVRRVAEESSVTVAALRSLFREHVGVSPKSFARLIAHDVALSTLNDLPAGRLTTAAHNLGFADQSHFIRDFTGLSGLTPGQYLALRGEPGSRSPFSHFLRLRAK